MKTLLEDRFAPITSTAGFWEAPLEEVEATLYQWSHSLNRRTSKLALADPFPEILHRLEPLTIPLLQRELLIGTASSWTAYFNNSLSGTDAFGPVSHLCQLLKCRGAIVSCAPHTIRFKDGKADGGRFGIIRFELYGAEQTEWLNCIRSVCLASDIGGWTFQAAGQVQPFEQVERYAARRKTDRFTAEMLEEYCLALGIRYFDPGYYQGGSILFEANRPMPPERSRSLTLEELQRERKIKPA